MSLPPSRLHRTQQPLFMLTIWELSCKQAGKLSSDLALPALRPEARLVNIRWWTVTVNHELFSSKYFENRSLSFFLLIYSIFFSIVHGRKAPDASLFLCIYVWVERISVAVPWGARIRGTYGKSMFVHVTYIIRANVKGLQWALGNAMTSLS